MELREKPKWLVLAILLIFVVSGLTIAVSQEMGASAVKTAAPTALDDRIAWVSGFNGTATQMLYGATSTSSNNVTLSFDHAPKYIVVAMNARYDVKGMLNSSDIYQTTSISLKGSTGTFVNLSAVYSVIGVENNGSNAAVRSSHAPSQVSINQTLFSTSGSNLGAQTGYSLFNLFGTSFTDKQMYIIELNYSHVNKTSGAVSLVFTNTLSGTGQNYLEIFEAGLFIAAFSGIAIMIYAVPRRH